MKKAISANLSTPKNGDSADNRNSLNRQRHRYPFYNSYLCIIGSAQHIGREFQ
jgi:hypothetical protein